jgi:hypothetical protein
MKSPNIKMFHKLMGIIWDHKRKKRGVEIEKDG